MNSASESNQLPRRIAISGATGLIGSALCDSLTQQGVTVLRFVRGGEKSTSETEILWRSPDKILEPEKLEGVDAVVHLAAKSLVGRWTDNAKKEMVVSRVQSTVALASTICGLSNRPKTFINASAIGIYGDRGDEILTEQSPAGKGFLADLGVRWESAASPLVECGVRTVFLRSAVVLSPESPAVKKIALPFKLGVGAVIGSGEQYVSFITLEDEVRAIEFALTHDSLSGPLNLSAPKPVTNREFSKSLGKTLSRPVLLKMPAVALKLLYGEQATTILDSARVIPEKLTQAGFKFKHSTIDEAWRYALD